MPLSSSDARLNENYEQARLKAMRVLDRHNEASRVNLLVSQCIRKLCLHRTRV